MMFFVGFAYFTFSFTCALLVDCNQYSICSNTLHGTTTESISYWTEEGYWDSIEIQITEEEYKESMYRMGLRFENDIFNMVPDEMVQPDRVVRVIGDHIMERYDDDYSRADAARRLVQDVIRYSYDNELYGVSDYCARPTETLYHLKGDCEDVTILFCSICEYMGIKTIFMDCSDHIFAGVKVDGCDGNYCVYSGERYYTCELTKWSSIGNAEIDDAIPYSDEPSYLYYFYSLYVSGAYRLISIFD